MKSLRARINNLVSCSWFPLSHFKTFFVLLFTIAWEFMQNYKLNTGGNDHLHFMHGTYDIFHSIFCRWKRNKHRYTYWVGWSPVLCRQLSPNHHNRRNRQHIAQRLCNYEYRIINKLVCLNIFYLNFHIRAFFG